MNKQAPPESSSSVLPPKQRKLIPYLVLARLLLAFGLGWLFTFLFVKSAEASTGVFLLGFSGLFVGIAAALTLGSGNRHLIALAAVTGLLAVAGIYVAALSFIMQDDAVADAYFASLIRNTHSTKRPLS